ncbi:homocysteine S-methyltransferase family protein [Alteromonas sp. S167]|uniref:homocysteine S-methyltransferase family protein n=1 Tax=Alteromonas sp. S167 TaxID=3117402 RepID=UPI002FDF8898
MKSLHFQLLDGGMGRELQRIGAPFKQPQWSALALMQAPNYVKQVHQHFINAGADILTTNTYALVPYHISDPVFSERALELANEAARIARECADEANRKPSNGREIRVAGCIPPAFGSYRPDLFDAEQLARILSPLIIAQENYIDFWLVETVSSIEEASCVIELIKNKSTKPIWLSYSLQNRHDFSDPVRLRSNELLTDALDITEQLEALLFNCSQPEEMEDAIRLTHQHNASLTLGAYANSFSEVKREHDANAMLSTLREDVSPDKYRSFAERWVDAGASVIGGCCGIGPEHIAELNKLRR